MELIICLKKTGVSLNEMKNILQLPIKEKLSSVPKLKRTLLNYKEKVISQIHELQRIVDFIDAKLKKVETLFRQQ
ncbi:MerR family transcriptional regulator [Cytobacillus praedii]|uniref:hypothetical protein n=1 Tax=Cytobacillus praedii TaxID=1742358 RepID=UPI00070D935D|nr:hypothetical protein [Cytobacillus praedii]